MNPGDLDGLGGAVLAAREGIITPILLGRALMRLTGFRPASENNLNVSALNGVLAPILGFERHILRRFKFPWGVSAICVARKAEA